MKQTRRAVLAAAPFVLAACGGTAATGSGPSGDAAPAAQIKPGATIQWAVDEGPTRSPLREDQVKLFKTQFPNLNVEYILGSTGTEKLQSLFAAGTPPDMFRQETAGLAFFASKSQMAPLDPFIKRDKYDLTDFFPAAWELWKWKGKYYGLPFLGIRIGFFNRALAQQTGAKVPTTWKDPAWTFQAFLEASQKMTARSGATVNRFGADMAAANARRDYQVWLWNNGGDLFNADGTKIEFDQPAGMEALEFLVDLIHKHRVSPTPQELQGQGNTAARFQNGSLAMYHAPVNGVASHRTSANFDWSLFGMPKGKAKSISSSGGGVGWFMTAASKVKDETWELMKVLGSKEGVRLEAVRGEAPPSRRSVANEPAFINPPEAPKGDMKVVVEALEAIHVETALLNGVEIDRILNEELTPVWRGEKALRQAIADASNKIKPLLNPAS